MKTAQNALGRELRIGRAELEDRAGSRRGGRRGERRKGKRTLDKMGCFSPKPPEGSQVDPFGFQGEQEHSPRCHRTQRWWGRWHLGLARATGRGQAQSPVQPLTSLQICLLFFIL